MQFTEIVGTRTTSVVITQHRAVVRGNGPDVSVIESNNASCVVCPYPPQTPDGLPVEELIIENVTLDAKGRATAQSASQYSCKRLVLRNVVVKNYTGNGVIGSYAEVELHNVTFEGTGKAMQASGDKPFSASGFVVKNGALGGFIKSDDGQATQILLKDGVICLDHWTRPGTDTTCNVSGLVVTPAVMPTSVELYDHVVMWDSAGGYVLGRVLGWTATTLTVQRWRRVDNTTIATWAPAAGSAMRYVKRHTDVGGIHVTSAAKAVIENVHVRGGWSDMITVRGSGSVLRNCSVSYGQDMGFTIDGVHVLEKCLAHAPNFHGFIFFGNGSIATDCAVTGYRVKSFSQDYGTALLRGCREE